MAGISETRTFFGQWLRQRRRSLDLTQTELARLIGCSAISVRKMEIGERRPSRQTAYLLADRLGIDDDELPLFIQFARTDQEAEHFRHPLFVEPERKASGLDAEIIATPENLFPTDFPGWIEIVSDQTSSFHSNRLLTAHFHSAPIDSPISETLQDGRQLCKIFAKGRIAGAIEGIVQQEVTQLHYKSDQPSSIVRTAVLFHIETEKGTIKGCCAGFMTGNRETGSERTTLQGKIYSVTNAYIDLLLADVYYESEVRMIPNGVKDQGRLHITLP
jgi:transcriptional regulator with XRE-family HTH domain